MQSEHEHVLKKISLKLLIFSLTFYHPSLDECLPQGERPQH